MQVFLYYYDMKRGKEIKIKLSDNYKTVSGTVDNKNPKSLYLTISGWGSPNYEDENINYGKVIRNMDKEVRKILYNDLCDSEFVKNKTIVDLDMRKSGVAFGKRSFMSCEVTLYQTEPTPINTKKMINKMEKISHHLINHVFESNQYFTFHKRKRD